MDLLGDGYANRISSDAGSFRLIVAAVLLALALAQSTYRYLQLTFGKQSLFVDAGTIWKPLAYEVLSGTPLYVAPAVDNKPPVFHLINVAIAATGSYDLVFTLLIGVANGLAAILLWRFLAQAGRPRAGVLASLLFLTTIPVVNGVVINVRSLALPFLIGAFLTRDPRWRGAGVAVAGLISQWAILTIPVAVYDKYKTSGSDLKEWFLIFSVSGLTVVAVAFLLLLPLWGWKSLINGVYWSFGVIVQFAGKTTRHHTFTGTPLLYMGTLAKTTLDSLIVTVPSAVLGYLTIREILDGKWGIEHLCLLLFVALAFQFLLRSYPIYWMYPLPFLCGVAAVGIARFLSGELPISA